MFRRTGVVHGIVGNIDVAESIVDLKYVPLESSGRPPSQFWEFFFVGTPESPHITYFVGCDHHRPYFRGYPLRTSYRVIAASGDSTGRRRSRYAALAVLGLVCGDPSSNYSLVAPRIGSCDTNHARYSRDAAFFSVWLPVTSRTTPSCGQHTS